MKSYRNTIFRFLQVAAFCVFAGRAYQHIFWDAPFRSLLWSEAWMSWIIVDIFQVNWSEYVRNPNTDITIQNVITGFGYFYALCALITLFAKQIPRIAKYLLLIGASSLIFLAFLYTKEKFFHFGQFFEYSLQFGSPIFLVALLRNEEQPKANFINILKIATALTFVCHGLYALNYYPRPGNFTQMCISILGIGEEQAYQFLTFAGVMDFIIAIGIFLPKRIAVPSLIYAIIWGFGTSIARVWANYYPEYLQDTLHQWGWETFMRFPHFVIPMAILFYILNKE